MSAAAGSSVEKAATVAGSKRSPTWLAAGVLPYCIQKGTAPTAASVFFLLGKELNEKDGRRYFWSDFGGSREAEDSSPEETAAREFSEETLGMFAGLGTSLTERVRTSTVVSRDRLQSEGCVIIQKAYYLFLLRFESPIEPLYFRLARDENDDRQGAMAASPAGPAAESRAAGEKRDFEWISGAKLLVALRHPQSEQQASGGEAPREAIYDSIITIHGHLTLDSPPY